MNWYNGFPPQQRSRALSWLRAQQAAGRFPIKPERCMATGATEGIIDFHSEDYSEPFGPHIGAYQFSYFTHMLLHCRFRSPEAWARYLDLLRRGAWWPPAKTRDFGMVREFLAGGHPPREFRDRRPVLIFDSMKLHATTGETTPPDPQSSFSFR